MENFDVGHMPGDEAVASNFMKADDLFYPCGEQRGEYVKRCYLHSAEHFFDHRPGDYAGSFNFCLTAPTDYRWDCFNNAARRIMQNNITKPLFVENLCGSAPAEFHEACIKGMLVGYTEFFPVPNRGVELCQQVFNKEDQAICPPSWQ